jgi:hypothetical protein
VYISPSQFSSTDVAFYYTSSVLSSQIDFYTSDYGTTGWYGLTLFYNGTSMYPAGSGPTGPYTWCKIQLNSTSSYPAPTNTWLAIAIHEMGHALGLAHFSGSIMDAGIAGLTTPSGLTSDDINGIRSLY